MKSNDFVFVGIKGSAIALNRATGKTVWEIHLKGSGFVHLVLDGENLYATTQGEIFCLNPETGEGRWNNELKGYGWGLTSIAVNHGSADANLAQIAAHEEEVRAQQSGAAVMAAS